MAQPFTTKQWSLWVQPDGPNTETHYLGCHTLDDLAENKGGIKDLIRCFRADGGGWDTIGSTRNPPETITTTITGLIDQTASWLERTLDGITCRFPIYVNGKNCPPNDVFGGAQRWYTMEEAEVGVSTLMGLAHRDEDNVSEQSFEITAMPPLIRGRAIQSDRLGMATFTDDANDVASCSVPRCAGVCGAKVDACDTVVIATDSVGGAAAPQILISYDNGGTWAATAADPFNVTENAQSIVCFPIDSDTTRILVARDTVAATPMHVEYSDDFGANWTDVTVTGSTNAYAAVYGGAMFALDQYHIWLVITDGAAGSEMWFSDDGGVTWTEQTLASPTDFYYAVWFKDELTGMVVGAADAIEITIDGGTTWAAATATGDGGDLLAVCESAGGGFWWVGSDDGQIYYSDDQGTVWDERLFPGSSAGAVYDLEFATPTVGFMAHSPTNATGRVYRTRDGGYTWELESATVDGELYSVHACSVNQAFTVGEVGAAPATALVLKSHD